MEECKYCKSPNGCFITDGLFNQSRIECYQDVPDGFTPRWTLCVNNSAWTEIKYCPICGRKLV